MNADKLFSLIPKISAVALMAAIIIFVVGIVSSKSVVMVISYGFVAVAVFGLIGLATILAFKK